MCNPQKFRAGAPCLIYSIGSQDDFRWEQAVLSSVSSTCEIHVFDHTVPHPVNKPSQVHYHPWGLASSKRNESEGNLKSLQAIVRELRHQGRIIDVLKVDCEGCEWEVFHDFFLADVTVQEVLIELHAGTTPSVNPPAKQFIKFMYDNDMLIFQKEPNVKYSSGNMLCVEYGFVRWTFRNSDAGQQVPLQVTSIKAIDDQRTPSWESGQGGKFYLVELEELFSALPTISTCGYTIHGAMSYERWKYHPRRTKEKSEAALIVFPPYLVDELNWPVYGGGVWENNFARHGRNPGSVQDRAGDCSLVLEEYIRTKYAFTKSQRYLLHLGSGGWDKGYGLQPEAYMDERAIVAKGNALRQYYRLGTDISLPPPFTDNLFRMRHMHATTAQNRSIFIGFKGSLDTHSLRKQIQEALHNSAADVHILGSNDDSLEYWELLSRSKFALIVRGHVSFSYRFSEVVCSGAVPVLISDDWVVPFNEVFPFEGNGIRILEANALQMVSVLSVIAEENITRLSRNAQRFIVT